ncbi:uncharacterized protein PGTG_12332 [Puccinia graminis f. sp. tritici CRL 75-36-700-3]|uniref:No apical meristem-associated C-terminal domain-containing protein n=1 Tax=Puccinia graminis f. sp. tritici (strain CRL 75-36-700-3 / race SCCL) TaxID=418459 RepID=E3KPZ1_PUCGT|nr:uncharacterized protein PGTG_12332 [Puccinia graminis f. sp. tritici CRL 75-36-700-3]EFP86376.2 hypothetical protein PGTG_12332 [Puccinia graminis f. sp. tritici CRL 75-36-700-3]
MATPTTPVEETTDTTQTKKKRGPNWLPREEEQLAISWINTSKQPEFATNQSGETFYWKIEKDFNTHSKAHYCDHGQIKTCGSSPEDWLEAAKMNYQDQTKGTAFNNLAAWQKLCYAPKWRADPRVDQTSTPVPIPSTDSIDPDTSFNENTITPSARSASSISCPIGGKAAKRLQIENYQHNELLSQTNKLAEISQERLTAFNKGNDILLEKNKIMQEKLEIERTKLQLEE